jgi:hypothetical protein
MFAGKDSLRNYLMLPFCCIVFWSIPAGSLAQVRISYFPDRINVQKILLENEKIKYTISLERNPKLAGAFDKPAGRDLMAGNEPLMFISVRMESLLADVGYQLFTLKEEKFGEDVSVTITGQSSYVDNPLVVTQTFSLGKGPELTWKAKVLNTATGGRSYRESQTIASKVTFPLLQKMKIGDELKTHYFLPTKDGFFCIDSPKNCIFYFTRASDPKLPIDIFNKELNCGIYFHILKTALELSFTDRDDFKTGVFELTQKPGEETEVIDCRICPHDGDWHVAFQTFKKYIRSGFDFTYYQRPIQEKFRQRFVSHFTFLYDHDIYNPLINEFSIDQFLDEGKLNFGGYDYILLWHDYPRMGIDSRDQFDMYEDLPGGLKGLREMADKAHRRGVQVFIPYKPWDIMKGREDHFHEEAMIAKAMGADGIFLDTMSESDRAFRDALDEVNPDIVFVAEGRPDLASAQLVTGSWNQQGEASNRMPSVDLFRFVFPEHNIHNINRGARKRDTLVYNSLFNGVGFIVWEDIFGEINRFSPAERVLITRYNRIIHENRDAYLTANPIPLVDNLREDLFVNAFPIKDKCVYSAYQLGREKVNRQLDNRLIGPFMEVDHPDNWHYIDIWNHQQIKVEKIDGRKFLIFREEPPEALSCIVGMPENLKVERDGEVLRVKMSDPIKGAFIQINTVDNLTMIEEERVKIEDTSSEVQLERLKLDFPYLVLVKLMQGDILKDEVIMDLSWKKF